MKIKISANMLFFYYYCLWWKFFVYTKIPLMFVVVELILLCFVDKCGVILTALSIKHITYNYNDIWERI